MYFFTSECRGFFIFTLQCDFWDVQKQDVIIQLCYSRRKTTCSSHGLEGHRDKVTAIWKSTPPTPRHLDLQGTMRSLGVGTKSSLWTGHDIYREISRGLQRLLLFLLNQLSPSLTHLVPLSNQSVIVGIDGQCTFDLIRWGVTSPLPLKSQ